ncbi:hypothetical protein HCG51_31310 [Tolypothrix sp. PCC 7910]|uniref:hypothetical protein n=1 Tax=Tolypothrix sp. PCC 7910 TaxID=2099387 RepID=UPI001427705F|nr:hypothetical protein [Tolypothrix sp. PCC 7910]QIR40743.1 hypothetical protein HCG51_31310 [Tolypothrix sp. PCC 7910]
MLTIPELRNLCLRYGLKPVGNGANKTSYLTTLMAFPELALQQMKDDRGLKMPSFGNYQAIGQALDEMNSPTDEQVALIRCSFEGRRMHPPQRYEQEKLLNLYRVKLLLEEVFSLLMLS